MTNTTLSYYNKNADDYFNKTISVNMNYEQILFLSTLPEGIPPSDIKILDVGAGSGRDSKIFKDLGYDITALEPSSSLVEKIKKNVDCQILPIPIQELDYDYYFDAIYASASLLHLSKNEMPNALSKIKKSLKPDGVFFMLLKEGLGEEIDSNGRYFSYYQEDELQELMLNNGFTDTIIIKKQGKLNSDISWLTSISLNESPNLILKNKLKKII